MRKLEDLEKEAESDSVRVIGDRKEGPQKERQSGREDQAWRPEVPHRADPGQPLSLADTLNLYYGSSTTSTLLLNLTTRNTKCILCCLHTDTKSEALSSLCGGLSKSHSHVVGYSQTLQLH